MDDSTEELTSAEAVSPSDTLVVEFTLNPSLQSPETYLDNPREGRDSLYGSVETVSHETDSVRLSSEHTFEPVDISFDRGVVVSSKASEVIGMDIAVYDYDEVTDDNDPAVEPFN